MGDKKENESEKRKPIVIRNTTDYQRLKLEKLMKNPEKPVIIPEKPKERGSPHVPDFVRNVMGSSAGAGSGEFHVYRHLRRKEYARQKYMAEKAERERQNEEYKKKIEDNKKLLEERTAKKRSKRLKKKQKQKLKKPKTNIPSEKSEESSESEEDSQENEVNNTEEEHKGDISKNDTEKCHMSPTSTESAEAMPEQDKDNDHDKGSKEPDKPICENN